jgi:hypothetical protein
MSDKQRIIWSLAFLGLACLLVINVSVFQLMQKNEEAQKVQPSAVPTEIPTETQQPLPTHQPVIEDGTPGADRISPIITVNWRNWEKKDYTVQLHVMTLHRLPVIGQCRVILTLVTGEIFMGWQAPCESTERKPLLFEPPDFKPQGKYHAQKIILQVSFDNWQSHTQIDVTKDMLYTLGFE